MLYTDEVIASSYDVRDYKIAAASEFPEKFQLTNLPTVKNQGNKPTCVAHAAASVIEYHHQKEHNKYRIFSTEFIYGFRDSLYYIGDGMMIRDALKTLKNYGVPFNSVCPGNHDVEDAMQVVEANLLDYVDAAYPHRIEAYYRCKSIDDIKTALMLHGPVLVSMNTYADAKIVDDTYTYDPSATYGRHCVLIYGWDATGWLIQNSWGKLWAGDGRFKLPFSFEFNEMWGLTDAPDPENIKEPNAFLIFIHRIWNRIVNFFRKRAK